MKEFRTSIAVIVALLAVTICSFAESPQQPAEPVAAPFYMQLSPTISIPLLESTNVFGIGGGMSFAGGYRLPFLRPVALRIGLEYGYDTTVAAPTISMTSASAGVGIEFRFARILGLSAFADAGYTYCFFNPPLAFQGHGNPFIKGGANLQFFLSPDFSLEVGSSLVDQIGLYTGLGVSAGMTIGLGGNSTAPQTQSTPVIEQPKAKPVPLENKPVEPPKPPATPKEFFIEKTELNPVFPVFLKYYDSHPLGIVKLTNGTNAEIKNIRVSFFIKDYMNAEQEAKPIDSIGKGESKDVDLFALFSDRILTVTERAKAQAEITVAYTAAGSEHELKKVESLTIVDRNAMTWDDNRKAAPFVTPKDTPVMSFAKNVASAIKGKGSKALNANFCMAMAMHEVLCAYGLAYVIDPKSAYTDFASKKTEIDYLQFPRQTLSFKGGDCDDLSILNCALLEAAGIDTAFITVPGHIFMAFSLGLKPDDARNQFTRADKLIFHGDQTWVPVEITQIEGGFLKAWELGAQEWLENSARNQADLYPLQEAWKVYEPVFFKGEDVQVAVPPSSGFMTQFLEEQIHFIDQEIYQLVSRLQAEIKKTQDGPRAMNKLGVLYAKYGLYDRAEKQFQQILTKSQYCPALVNLGNIRYAQGKMDEAGDYYTRAYKINPDNSIVLLCLARLNHDQENYGAVHKYYSKLQEIDADLASKFTYLDLRGQESARAADISGAKEVMVWSE